MADKMPVTMQLFRVEGTVPPPDDLIAGGKGAVYTDLAMVSTTGAFKRGTLMMTDADGYVPATSTGLATAGGICILSEDITVGENEYIDTPAYFEGKFNDARVIFQFEGEDDRLLTCEHAVRHHAALVETVCEPLRKAKIFLRHLNS